MKEDFVVETPEQIIFTKGTTDGINIVASAWAENQLQKGDEILITTMEHHSNIVPWQMLCEKLGAKLVVCPINDAGEILMDELKKLIRDRTKLIAVTHVSNTLGTINPIKVIIDKAHEKGAAVLIDGAQATSQLIPAFQKLNVDFYVTSAHKMCGPTGVGILYGKEKWLQELPPYQGGGEMIKEVSFEKTTYADLPHKFEAGTPNIAGGIAFGAAVDYLNSIGLNDIAIYENELLKYATKELLKIDGVKIYGTSSNKTAVISFNIDKIHPYDIGTIIDKLGVEVRTGQHCTQPIMDFYKISGTIRASFAFYNTKEEIDIFIAAINKAKMMLS